MRKSNLLQNRKKTEEHGCLNKNCWLVKILNYAPYGRCNYCEFKFRNCLFLHYQIASLIFVFFFLTLSFLINGKISKLATIFVFVSVIICGYFFNKSTEKIIKANFAEKKAKEALEELTKKLKKQVNQRTKKLKKAYEELKVLDKAKSEFISMASHQLRTPLTILKGYVSMILEGDFGKISKKVKEKLFNIFQSNERLIRLVNELLNISRIELGKMELKEEVVQIENLIQSCCDEVKIQVEKKKLKLTWQKFKNPLPKIKVDPFKIRQVVLNLIDNALKYTKSGEIKIKAEKINSFLQISIKDTGEGLAKEEQKNIFKGFVRGRAGVSCWTEGAGLGLYVAKKYLELYQGKIWAESEGIGKGSTFYIEIPINT